ncbi:hypothetical protein VPH35_033723 [Triticum aestivum]|uniref:uncharacterized protein n=1 Tax=Triticum aestivum TaxID=4565 RepID=UPI001ABC5BC0|nr:uncharacterized protein LOC120974838 [Aegilops tauschii subsp. strangulata]XP_044327286.1 uncharacterized protein LOC123048203 [Triticum aestivum]
MEVCMVVHAPASPSGASAEPQNSPGHRDSSPKCSVEMHLMEQPDSMVEFAHHTTDEENVQGDNMVEFVPDTINQEVEESPDEERSSDVSITDVDEDSIEYLRRQVVEDSEEEDKQEEVYQKVRKEFNERRASDAALRREARARNASRHKSNLNKIRRDFLRIYIPDYYKMVEK